MQSMYHDFFIDPILAWSIDNDAICDFEPNMLDFTIKKNNVTVFVVYVPDESSVLMTDNRTNLQFMVDKMDKQLSPHALCLFFGNN
uniref:Uncharacterized protein n=1 Tax=viral metagenome TaxID=1070528 RepID=A0A6C0CB11_9ZZZZ